MNNYFQGKRVLVTGGAGFVGSNLVNRLVTLGAIVTVLDDLFTGRKENINNFRCVYFVEGSVIDSKLVNKLVSDSELVFHLAVRNIIVSTTQPELDFEVNVRGFFNILSAIRKHQIKRLIYTSSASVYGNPDSFPTGENVSPNILSPYAASKFCGENYCAAFYEMYNTPVVVLRYSNIYGTNQSPDNPYCGVVSKFFDNLMNKKTLQIHGDGKQTRDFTYIDDATKATLLAAQNPQAIGEKFNIGSGIETSIDELAFLVSKIVGQGNSPIYVKRRDIDNINRRILNIEKARHVLRWVPQTSLKEGLQKTYQWLLSTKK